MDRDSWETPQNLFDWLHGRFGFNIDGAARRNNTKLPRWTHDLFVHTYLSMDRVFCNPPYSLCGEVVKHFQKLWDGHKVPSLLLIPVRSDRIWWNEARKHPDCRFEFYTGRLKFSGSKTSAFMYSMNLIFGFEEVETVDPIDASLFGGGRART